MRLVGLEEHMVTTDVIQAWRDLPPEWQDLSREHSSTGDVGRRLLNTGSERLADMDSMGLDVQVLSLTTPGLQDLAPEKALELQTRINDSLAEAVRGNPDRLQAFATLATPNPPAAARELERAVKTLGLHGAMIFGRTRNRNLDHPDSSPLFEVANSLRCPLYLHPQSPRPAVREAYYQGFGDQVDMLFGMGGLGWHVETGVQLIRMILAGVFDRYPDLRIVVGHWGEVVAFYLDRIDLLTGVAKLKQPLSEYFKRHIYVTPSGIFSQRYCRWAIEVFGVNRVMFSTDYPFQFPANGKARCFMEEAELSDADRQAIGSGNWDSLCAQIRR